MVAYARYYILSVFHCLRGDAFGFLICMPTFTCVCIASCNMSAYRIVMRKVKATYFLTSIRICATCSLSFWLQLSVHVQRRVLQSGDWQKELGWCCRELSSAEQCCTSGSRQWWCGNEDTLQADTIPWQFVSVSHVLCITEDWPCLAHDIFITCTKHPKSTNLHHDSRNPKPNHNRNPTPNVRRSWWPPKYNRLMLVVVSTLSKNFIKILQQLFELYPLTDRQTVAPVVPCTATVCPRSLTNWGSTPWTSRLVVATMSSITID